MNDKALARFAPLTGLLFAGLLVTVRIIEGTSLPDSDDPTLKVVAFWTNHSSEQITVSIMASFAAVFLLWFAGILRGVLWEAEDGSGTLAALTFGGAIVAVAGMLANATVEFAAAHSAGDVPAQVTQTLSALQADTFFPIAAGFGVFGIAAGLAVLQTNALPRWLGWVSLVGGVLWLTPGEFVAIFLSVIFVVCASFALFRRTSGAQRAASQATP